MRLGAATLGEGLNCSTLEWTTGGTPSSFLPNENVNWWYCSGDGVSDNACVSSGGGSGGITTSWLQTTIKGPCKISFQYRIMTYNGTFTVQCGEEILYEYTGITGISPVWKYAEYVIPSGTHQLTFTYRHPGQGYAYVQNGFNGVRIDDFKVASIIPKLKEIAINGPSTTFFGSANCYEAVAIYDDDSRRKILPNWSLILDEYISLSPNGILRLCNLPLTLQLNASYTENGISKSTSFNVNTSLDISSTSIVEYTYELNPGWQLVSIVMNLDETSKAALLELKPFCFSGNCYFLANDLPAGISCWVFVPRKTTIKVSGTPCGMLKTKQLGD